MADELTDGIELASAIAALRREVTKAWDGSQGERIRFKPSAIELTLDVAVTKSGEGSLGVKWWLISAGGKASRGNTMTQTLKLTLTPVLIDENGQPNELYVSDADQDDPDAGSGDELL